MILPSKKVHRGVQLPGCIFYGTRNYKRVLKNVADQISSLPEIGFAHLVPLLNFNTKQTIYIQVYTFVQVPCIVRFR